MINKIWYIRFDPYILLIKKSNDINIRIIKLCFYLFICEINEKFWKSDCSNWSMRLMENVRPKKRKKV